MSLENHNSKRPYQEQEENILLPASLSCPFTTTFEGRSRFMTQLLPNSRTRRSLENPSKDACPKQGTLPSQPKAASTSQSKTGSQENLGQIRTAEEGWIYVSVDSSREILEDTPSSEPQSGCAAGDTLPASSSTYQAPDTSFQQQRCWSVRPCATKRLVASEKRTAEGSPPEDLNFRKKQHEKNNNYSPNWLRPDVCSGYLSLIVASFGGLQSLSYGLKLRIKKLRDASQARAQDVQFMIMHQVACIIKTEPSRLPIAFATVPALKEHCQTFEEALFGPVAPSEIKFLRMLADFPVSPERLSVGSHEIGAHITAARIALTHIKSWNSLQDRCLYRQKPPFVEEFEYEIRLSSPVCQRLLFYRTLEKILGQVNGMAVAGALEVFEENRFDFYSRRRNIYLDLQSIFDPQSTPYWREYEILIKSAKNRRYLVPAPVRALTSSGGTTAQENRSSILQADRPTTCPISLISDKSLELTRESPDAIRTPQICKRTIPPFTELQECSLSISSRSSPHKWRIAPSVTGHDTTTHNNYEYIEGFVCPPQDLFARGQADEITFTIAEPVGELGLIFNKTFRFLLRIVAGSRRQSNMVEWLTIKSKYPPSFFLDINGRKIQSSQITFELRSSFGSYDITHLLISGRNTVKIWSDKNYVPTYYSVAVEKVSVKTGNQIRDQCMRQTIPAEVSKEMFRACLTSATSSSSITTPGSNEDEMEITPGSYLKIKTIDPVSLNRMIKTPVRGNLCKHRECFDLDVFLETRRCGQSDGSSRLRDWKCPVCGADARPSVLRVDGYLLEIGKELQRRLEEHADHQLTRAIFVFPDGSWTPETETESAKLENKGLIELE